MAQNGEATLLKSHRHEVVDAGLSKWTDHRATQHGFHSPHRTLENI